MAYDWEFRVRSKGIWTSRLQLTDDSFFNIPIILPPLDEQQKIVNFIQQQDRRIRRFIRNKKKLIELLQERRRTLILDLLRGAIGTSSDELVSSNIEWLNSIRKHWKEVKIAHYAKVFNGSTPSRAKEEYWQNGDIPWLSSSKVNDQVVECPSEYVTKQALRNCAIALVPKNSVIIGLVGQGKTRGTASILGIETCISQNIAAIVPDNRINPSFLVLVLRASYQHIRNLGKGGNQAALNCGHISSLKIPLPSLKEQAQILDQVSKLTTAEDKALERAQNEILLIREFQSRLISDAVTGKIDLRSMSLEQTDEPIEDELSDISSNGFDADTETETEDEELLEEAAHAN